MSTREVTRPEQAQSVQLRDIMRRARVAELANRQSMPPDPALTAVYASIYEDARLAHLISLAHITIFALDWDTLMGRGDDVKAPHTVAVVAAEQLTQVGQGTVLEASVLDEDGQALTGIDALVTWRSRDSSRVTVRSEGISATGKPIASAQAVGVGEVEVYAEARNGRKGGALFTIT